MRRQFVWPPGSVPVVEFDGRWRTYAKEAVLAHETRRRVDQQFAAAKTWKDLCELSAQFCEGKLPATPDHGGPRCPETVPIAAELARANRQGFLTTCSQSGVDEPWGDSGERFQQRPAVEGYASPETVQKLRTLIAGTRLEMQVAEKRPVWRTDFSNGVNVTRSLWPDGAQEWHTGFGVVPSQRAHFSDLGRPDLTQGAHVVTIYDPEYGDHRLLWDRLGQPDWDNPTPPAETRMSDQAATAPAEPPVGAILETQDDIGPYRVERTNLGWHIQHAGGSDEFGNRLTSFGGRGISWRAAWSAWGPPSGAAPFREIPPGTPALPADPPEQADMKQRSLDQTVRERDARQGTDPGGDQTTNSSTPTGGAGMSKTEEGKQLTGQAKESVTEAQGQAQQSVTEIDEAIAALRAAAEGSDQDEYEAAIARLEQLKEQGTEFLQGCGQMPDLIDAIAW